MSWVAQTPLVAVLLGYLVFLFLIAAAAERFGRRLQGTRLRTVTYVLAISVYCTAWTFYGSVGLAANRGLEFLTIYLGPALIALTWPTLLRKLVRVAKEQRITTISDFIGSRYGKSAGLGTLVAVLVVCGMIPYIALQLKAVSTSFTLIMREGAVLDVFDPTLLVAGTLAVFGILFGAVLVGLIYLLCATMFGRRRIGVHRCRAVRLEPHGLDRIPWQVFLRRFGGVAERFGIRELLDVGLGDLALLVGETHPLEPFVHRAAELFFRLQQVDASKIGQELRGVVLFDFVPQNLRRDVWLALIDRRGDHPMRAVGVLTGSQRVVVREGLGGEHRDQRVGAHAAGPVQAANHGLLDRQMIQQRDRVVRELLHRVRARSTARSSAEPAQIRCNATPAGGKAPQLRIPHPAVQREGVQEQPQGELGRTGRIAPPQPASTVTYCSPSTS